MLRRYAPKSLYWRVVLIVILPIFMMQSVVTYIFFARHWDRVSANQSNNVAGQVALLTRLYTTAPNDDARNAVVSFAASDLDIDIQFEPIRELSEGDLLSPFNVYNTVLNNRLKARIDRPYRFDTQSWRDYVEIVVLLDDGRLRFLVLNERAFATTGPIFLFWLFGTSVLLGWIATIFMRNQVKSILRLANAAEAFGRGRDAPDFRPGGAMEVRKAGFAFIAMRERIKRHLDQRASMLTGVSHDLRTPLTRIKLGLALEKDTPEIEALRGDVLEMERMVEAYLDFARNEAAEEDLDDFDLAALMREVVDDAERAGGVVSTNLPAFLHVSARRIALKRATANLVNNAMRHGSKAWITISRNGGSIKIVIDDNGPGIPAEDHEKVFRPFTRLDAASPKNDTGVGMGLTIVRDVARSHGGDVKLSPSPHGGLRATIALPL